MAPKPKDVVFFATAGELRAWFDDNGLDDAGETAFRTHRAAWSFFESQPPWYRRTAAYGVMSAKRAETRDRRLNALIESSRKGERVPPLRRP